MKSPYKMTDPELSAAVAVEVMGWHEIAINIWRTHDGKDTDYNNDEYALMPTTIYWSPSTDWNHVMEAARHATTMTLTTGRIGPRALCIALLTATRAEKGKGT